MRRGDITFWFDEDVIDAWDHDNADWKVGRPYVYSDLAIETLLTLLELFRLPYRQTEGLGRSLATLMGANIAIPDFTSLQKRAAKMQVQTWVFVARVTARNPRPDRQISERRLLQYLKRVLRRVDSRGICTHFGTPSSALRLTRGSRNGC